MNKAPCYSEKAFKFTAKEKQVIRRWMAYSKRQQRAKVLLAHAHADLKQKEVEAS